MIEIYKNSKIYVLCPAYVKTGGPELLHQLVSSLRKRNLEAFIVYTGVNENDSNYTNEDFKVYNVKYILENDIEDDEKNVLIIPEIKVKDINKYNNIRKAIWWLSVDNYKKNYSFIPAIKLTGLKHALKIFFNGTIIFHGNDYKKAEYNLCQSYYAINFLKSKKTKNILYLSDYINNTFMEKNVNGKKKNNVLYNPKKGIKFTKRIIKKSQGLNWIPIKNLTTDQVKNLLIESKVYVDFGNHPGKDRFPREAAMCDCCVITGKRGSAKYYEDVPINEEFKFEENNIEVIINKIRLCLNDYENQIKNFEEYKEYIKNEETKFQEDIDKIFIKKEN